MMKHLAKLGSNACFVAVSTIVLRDQQPALAIELVEPWILLIDDVLSVIDQPRSNVLKRLPSCQILARETLKLVCERHHALRD